MTSARQKTCLLWVDGYCSFARVEVRKLMLIGSKFPIFKSNRDDAKSQKTSAFAIALAEETPISQNSRQLWALRRSKRPSTSLLTLQTRNSGLLPAEGDGKQFQV